MTAAELFALPPDPPGVDRWLFAGQLIERWNGNRFHTPAHSATVATVSALLSDWCHGVNNRDHRAYGYGCPYRLTRNPDTLVSFDAGVVEVCAVNTTKPDDAFIEGAPLLAVEVIELDEDPDLLQRLVEESIDGGVPSMWVIDPFEEIVVWHRPNAKPVYINGGMELAAGPQLPGLRCRVAEIFE
jgi:Uma2 family endonuclease